MIFLVYIACIYITALSPLSKIIKRGLARWLRVDRVSDDYAEIFTGAVLLVTVLTNFSLPAACISVVLLYLCQPLCKFLNKIKDFFIS